MRYLFIHPNFPSQHGPFAAALAKIPGNQVVFVTENPRGELPGVKKVLFKSFTRKTEVPAHPYIASYESAILQGQGAAKAFLSLKKAGWLPDVILGHAGWGATLFARDIFPKARLINNFEWYYNSRGGDADFDPESPIGLDDELRIRAKNATLLSDLAVSDVGIAPTHWQKAQFPMVFHPKLEVLHEGIDVEFIKPLETKTDGLEIPRIGLDLRGVKNIVTYVSRGLEPYRGFPQFMASLGLLLELSPETHVVIVGEDRVAYGRQAPEGTTYKKMMLEKYKPDLNRVHFTNRLSKLEYLQVLQASSAHVYLTYPFVLSWSMMEAMAAGCIVVGSNTGPVKELIDHEFNGVLVDFFDSEALAKKLHEVVANQDDYKELRIKARETITHKYDQRDLFKRRLRLLDGELRGVS